MLKKILVCALFCITGNLFAQNAFADEVFNAYSQSITQYTGTSGIPNSAAVDQVINESVHAVLRSSDDALQHLAGNVEGFRLGQARLGVDTVLGSGSIDIERYLSELNEVEAAKFKGRYNKAISDIYAKVQVSLNSINRGNLSHPMAKQVLDQTLAHVGKRVRVFSEVSQKCFRAVIEGSLDTLARRVQATFVSNRIAVPLKQLATGTADEIVRVLFRLL